MSDFSQAEQSVIDDFRSLTQEQQEELVVNLGLETVASTMELLGFREDETHCPECGEFDSIRDVSDEKGEDDYLCINCGNLYTEDEVDTE